MIPNEERHITHYYTYLAHSSPLLVTSRKKQSLYLAISTHIDQDSVVGDHKSHDEECCCRNHGDDEPRAGQVGSLELGFPGICSGPAMRRQLLGDQLMRFRD